MISGNKPPRRKGSLYDPKPHGIATNDKVYTPTTRFKGTGVRYTMAVKEMEK